MNIYLVGYRGTGKTALSRGLSLETGIPSVDTDELIVEREGMTIPRIFEEKGQDYFRDCESQILQEVSTHEGQLIVATGGGIVIREQNRELLKRQAKCIWLKADTDTVYKRIAGDENRPALSDKSARDEIVAMLEQRTPWYEEVAGLTLDTGEKDYKYCLQAIKEYIGKQE